MSHYKQQAPEDKDPTLWKIAQKRASFKRHAIVYTIVNIFLWAQWYFITIRNNGEIQDAYPWPIWATLGWGFGLACHFAGAYVFPKINSVEREYQKLKSKQ